MPTITFEAGGPQFDFLEIYTNAENVSLSAIPGRDPDKELLASSQGPINLDGDQGLIATTFTGSNLEVDGRFNANGTVREMSYSAMSFVPGASTGLTTVATISDINVSVASIGQAFDTKPWTVIGSNERDRFFSGEAADVFRMGGGDDAVSARGGNDRVFGEAGNDSIGGGEGDDFIDGGTGDDAILGEDGNDVMLGGDGDDILIGGNGNDRIIAGAGTDFVSGGTGDDTFIAGAAAGDTFNGGAGTDIANLTASTAGVRVSTNAADPTDAAATHTLIEVETVFGSRFDDRIEGSEANERLIGMQGNDVLIGEGGSDLLNGALGNDVLFGGDGNDLLYGTAGNDFLFGGAGADALDGGAGYDVASYTTAGAAITLDMRFGRATGDATGDRLFGIEEVRASAFGDRVVGGARDDVFLGRDGNDTLLGNFGDDDLRGENGNDRVFGGAGDDALSGGDGNDLVFGGAGDDVVSGGAGNDLLIGGTGADVFAFGPSAGADRVRDFASNMDVIDLTKVASVASFDDLTLRDVAAGTLVTWDETGTTGSALLIGVDATTVDVDDFVFAEPADALIA